MKIERKNIIELIGKRANAYHSCIITCYSLDFAFFEERVLPSLRIANIKNVNLFCDGYYLEAAQEMVSGKEFKHNKNYNFIPVYEKGVFHPKIIFLAGEKNGLLLVGSGNITSSGLSTNDEIWAAFHINTAESENAMVFAQVWNYLESLFSNARGFIPEKLGWLRKYAPWINELPTGVEDIRFEDKGIDFNFIFNKENNSTYSQIKTKIKTEKLKSLTSVSPFYDKNGFALSKIIEEYKPSTVNCILEGFEGTVPTDMAEKFADQIKFFSWKDCKSDFNDDVNRLHAKLLHFEFENSEALYFGSANITEAAFGTRGTAANGEAGILLRRNGDSNWLKDLGITLPKKSIDIKSLTKPKNNLSNLIPRLKFQNRILYSELNGSSLSLYLKEVQNEPCSVLILDRAENETVLALPNSETEKITVRVKPDDIFRVVLADSSRNQISNFSFVHRVELLAHTNPDPKYADLSNLLNDDYPNFEGISKLLKHIDFSFADDEDYSDKKVDFSQSKVAAIKDSRKPQYKIAEFADFVRSYDDYSLELNILNGSNHRIFSKLKGLLKFQQLDQGFDENAEQFLMNDEEQQGDGGDIKKKSHHVYSENELNFIKDYFRKLNRTLEFYNKEFYEKKSNNWEAPIKVDISLLSNILISLELIIIFQGKITKENKPIFVGGEFHPCDVTTIKGYFATTIGCFLKLCHSGFKNYELDNLKNTLEDKKASALARILFIICNQRWKDEEFEIVETIILDAMHYLKSSSINSLDALENKLEKLRRESSYVYPFFRENFEEVMMYCDYYQKWFETYNDMELRKQKLVVPTKDLLQNEIIFGSKIGFCIFSRLISIEDKYCKVSLRKAGFPSESDFYIDNFNYGKSAVVLENDN